MLKTIIKEVFIMILLLVAIALILGVVFYDYIPNNKAVPNKLSEYKTPEDVKAEIEQEVIQMEQEEIYYQIDGYDLSLYKQTNGYKSGKINPFSPIVTEGNVENAETGGSTTTNSGGTSSGVDQNSIEHFFDDKGLK